MIKFLVMDVDGTLTDGKVYMGNDGEVFKAFDIKDGCGILMQLPKHGIIPVIITARTSQILLNRCKEIGITEIHQGVRAKLDCLNEILAKYSTPEYIYSLADVAYIGDDLLDLLCLEPVKAAGGLAACPSNAIPEVIACCDYVAPHKGGEGAVRDLIEYIIKKYNKAAKSMSLDERLNKAVEYISNLDFENLSEGCYGVSDDFFYSVQEYETEKESEVLYESHKDFIDIQWLVSGFERLYLIDVARLIERTYYEESDKVIYEPCNNQNSIILRPGSCAIIFPEEAHKAAAYFGKNMKIKKVVGKLKLKCV